MVRLNCYMKTGPDPFIAVEFIVFIASVLNRQSELLRLARLFVMSWNRSVFADVGELQRYFFTNVARLKWMQRRKNLILITRK